MHKINLCNFLTDKTSVFVIQSTDSNCFNDDDSWVILSSVEQTIKDKIIKLGTPLKDWNVRINRGILTGYNEAFIIDEHKRNDILSSDPKSAEIIRPILRGRDIKKYACDFAGLYLINSHNGVKEKDLKPILIDDYPSVKQHLDKFYPRIEKRADKGDTPYNLRNCAYMEDFYKQKIIWGEISDTTKFSIDYNGEYMTEATTFLLTGDSLLYILAFLNSKISQYLFSLIGTKTGVGTIRWKKYTIEQLLIPKINKDREATYDKLVTSVLDTSGQADRRLKLLSDIDNLVYEDFNLSDEEIGFIESQ